MRLARRLPSRCRLGRRWPRRRICMNGLRRVLLRPGTDAGKLRHRLLLTIASLAVAGLISLGLLKERGRPVPGTAAGADQANQTLPLVTTVEAERRPLPQWLAVGGTLVARHEIAIGAEVSGSRIETVLVDEGDRVVKGQILAKLDAAVLQAQLRHASATAEDASVAAAAAAADFKRADGIRGSGAISLEEIDQRRTAAQSATARLAAAQAEVSELQSRIAETE